MFEFGSDGRVEDETRNTIDHARRRVRAFEAHDVGDAHVRRIGDVDDGHDGAGAAVAVAVAGDREHTVGGEQQLVMAGLRQQDASGEGRTSVLDGDRCQSLPRSVIGLRTEREDVAAVGLDDVRLVDVRLLDVRAGRTTGA